MLNYKDSTGTDIVIGSLVHADRDEENMIRHLQIKNCYQILITKCQKHEVSALLKTLAIGDSRELCGRLSLAILCAGLLQEEPSLQTSSTLAP